MMEAFPESFTPPDIPLLTGHAKTQAVPAVTQGRLCMKEQGIVKWFNGAKGYGFIQRSTGEDVFVHFSAIQDEGYKTLNEGEPVVFECLQGPKGLNATNVLRAS